MLLSARSSAFSIKVDGVQPFGCGHPPTGTPPHGWGALPKSAEGSVHLADQAHELARFDLVMPHVAADNARDLFNNTTGCRTSFGYLRSLII